MACSRLGLLIGLVAVLAAPVSTVVLAADRDSNDRIHELELRIAELEALIHGLEETDKGVDPNKIEELERQIRILAEEIEDLKMSDVVEPIEDIERGLGPSASKVYQVDRGVSVGGYGELLYENFASEQEDSAPSGKTDQLDLLRAVLYFGYKFNDRIVFNSEIEYEHASTGREGEVSVEFAYLDFLFRDAVNVRAGLILLPMGFVNELHEPPTFLGARRPYVETLLIPTTWRENGAGVYGEHGPISYRAYVTNGLAALGGTSYKEKVGATRGSTSEGSIQNRFGGSSGLVLGGGSGGTASSGGTTGAVMGNRVLDGGPQGYYRDDRPSDHSKKWGEQPGKGYAKGHAKRTH